MSLINQMLQELDARRSEVPGSDPYGKQIRVVPERSRVIHPAWWIALALAVITGVLVGWLFLRPPAQMSARPVGMQLPLKLDADLSLGSRATAPAAAPEKPVEPGDAALAPKPAEIPRQNAPLTDSQAVAPLPQRSVAVDTVALAKQAPPASKPTEPAREPRVTAKESVKEANDVTALELAKVVPPAKSLLKSPAAKLSEPPATIFNKQFKELTPQQRAENEYRKAISALQQGKSGEAIASLELALQLDPQHAGARHTLIGMLVESKRNDDALRVAGDGMSADPAQPALAMILARLQLDKGDLHKAIETLERTLVYATDRADYQAFLAALLQRDEQHKQAVEHYLQALQRSPQSGVWWMGLGISLQAERRMPEAQEAFKRAKATNTLSPELIAFVDARLSQIQR